MFLENHQNIKLFTEEYDLPIVLNSVGLRYNQTPENRPKGLPYHHIIWVVKGQGIFNSEGKTFHLIEGQGLISRAHSAHSYCRSGDQFETAFITFYGCNKIMDYYNIGRDMIFDVPSFLTAATESLFQFCRGNSTVFSRSSQCYSLIIKLFHEIFFPVAPVSQKITQYLEHHFSEDITLDDIAAEVNMGKFSLCHYYSKECGITIMDHLKNIRTNMAKQYLKNTTYSINEIGKMCGFNSSSYFGKIFREVEGCSPREYRDWHSDN